MMGSLSQDTCPLIYMYSQTLSSHPMQVEFCEILNRKFISVTFIYRINSSFSHIIKMYCWCKYCLGYCALPRLYGSQMNRIADTLDISTAKYFTHISTAKYFRHISTAKYFRHTSTAKYFRHIYSQTNQ